MAWSKIKVQGFQPSPRTGCCGVLCGTKWYIIGGGSRKKRHTESLVFDVIKKEWSVAFKSPPYFITMNKGFSLVLVQHKERDFLIAFGGCTADDIFGYGRGIVALIEMLRQPISGNAIWLCVRESFVCPCKPAYINFRAPIWPYYVRYKNTWQAFLRVCFDSFVFV